MPTFPPRFTADTALADTSLWPPAALAALHEAGLGTVGAVLGVAATQGGRQALSAQTGLASDVLQQLLAATADGLPVAERLRLSRPADTRGYGLGALPPSDD